jgi:hypothetical protein
MSLPSSAKTHDYFFRKVQSYMTEYERKPLRLKERKTLSLEEKDTRIEVLEKQVKTFNVRTKRSVVARSALPKNYTGPKSAPAGPRSEKIPEGEKITSKSRICFDQLQHGTCKRTACTYNHTDLTDEQRSQAEKLLEEVKGSVSK